MTRDHSLFDCNKNEIKPNEITHETKLEYNENEIWDCFNNVKYDTEYVIKSAKMLASKTIDRVPMIILNSTIKNKNNSLRHLVKMKLQLSVIQRQHVLV